MFDKNRQSDNFVVPTLVTPGTLHHTVGDGLPRPRNSPIVFLTQSSSLDFFLSTESVCPFVLVFVLLSSTIYRFNIPSPLSLLPLP